MADETKAYPVTTGDEISAMAEISVDFMVMVLLFMEVMCDGKLVSSGVLGIGAE